MRRIQEFEDTAYTIAEAYIAVIARFTDPVWSLPPESQSLDFSKLPQLYLLDVNGEELLVERAFTRELIIMHGQTKFVHRVYRETDQEIIQLREILQSHLAAII